MQGESKFYKEFKLRAIIKYIVIKFESSSFLIVSKSYSFIQTIRIEVRFEWHQCLEFLFIFKLFRNMPPLPDAEEEGPLFLAIFY